MKKISTIILSLLLVAVFILPIFASAATSPGIKPGGFFYFFDTSFEKIGLFFTFSPEKKARRALQYADERLAEIEVIAEEKDTDAVKTAISNYENNVALAAEKSKEVTDKAKAESLLTSIEDKTEKNQEVLSVVLTKVPEEAREGILRAISASRKGQEEAAKQIAELKGEVEKLKQEVEELKTKDEEREKVIEELSKPKTEKPVTQQKISAPVAPIQKLEQTQTLPKTNITTLPSGAVVEMDAGGNIVRYVKKVFTITTTPTLASIPTSILSPSAITPSTTSVTPPITPIPALPKVIVSPGRVDYRNNQSYKKPGEKDYIFAGIKITTDKKVILNSIKWHQSGSASFTGIYDNGTAVYSNVKTYVDDIAHNISFSTDGKYVISELGGIILNPDEIKNIYLKGDLAQIVCGATLGCSTYTGLICKDKEQCPGCKDDGAGGCYYPYKHINVDIYNPKDISIADENGNTIIPQAEYLWNYENSGGFRNIVPWYDGYKIEMEPQPPRP